MVRYTSLYHEILFNSPDALSLGKTHFLILQSEIALDKRTITQDNPFSGIFKPIKLTPFGLEIGPNFISFYVCILHSETADWR